MDDYFDHCASMTMDNAGVDMAVKAFIETNFYCPKPNTSNVSIDMLWQKTILVFR